MTAIYLQKTRHVVAAYTQKSGGGEKKLSSMALDQMLPDGLLLRRLLSAEKRENKAYLPRTPLDPRFKISSSELEAVQLKKPMVELISRPGTWELAGEEPTIITQRPGIIDHIEFTSSSSGVTIALKLKNGVTGNVPPIPIVCAMRTGDKDFISTAEIPGGTKEDELKDIVSFPVIPAGENQFLFFLKGFRPIFQSLKHKKTEECFPAST